MDAMALLCMLHADGPATLKNLRRAGCSSLEAIESMDEERLSKLLGAPAAAARRFAREARHLRERLGLGLLDREETAVGENGGQPQATAALAAQNADGRDGPWPGQDVVEEALAAWRARDLAELESPTTPAEPAAAPTDLAAVMSELEEPAVQWTEIPATPQRLAVGEVDGLDEERSRLLAEAGVRTLEDLARADALELSRGSGLGYTDTWRLTALARRAMSGALRSSVLREIPAAEPMSAKVSLSEQPLREEPSILELEWNREIQPSPPPPRQLAADVSSPRPQREGAGGPFA
jgi:hypothetical protein